MTAPAACEKPQKSAIFAFAAAAPPRHMEQA
jgi:hypothetical protein